MVQQYQMAGISINVAATTELQDTDGFALYRVRDDQPEYKAEPDYQIYLIRDEKLPEDLGKEVFRNELNRVGKRSDGYFHTFYRAFTDQIIAWNKVTDSNTLELHYLAAAEDFFHISTNVFNASSLERILHRFQKYIFHCSYVAHNGKAVLFSAPSGGGKTTQGLLWEQYAGAEMINGDRCILEKTTQGYVCHGLPIAGSSGVFTNKTLPLAGIFRVQKDDHTQIDRLSPMDAFHAVFTELTINGWDSMFRLDAVDFAMELASRVPLYKLRCRKDEEAVKAAREVIEQHYS